MASKSATVTLKGAHLKSATKEPVVHPPVESDDASESDDTDIGAEEECPPEQSTIAAAPTTTNGVPDAKTARGRKRSAPGSFSSSSSSGKVTRSKKSAADMPGEMVTGKRRAAAAAGHLIHACSATGQAEARVASAHARELEAKKRARRRAAAEAAKAAAGTDEPPAKKARRSTSVAASSKKTKASSSGAAGKKKTAGTAKKAAGATKKPKSPVDAVPTTAGRKRKTPASAVKSAAPKKAKTTGKTPAKKSAAGTKKAPAKKPTAPKRVPAKKAAAAASTPAPPKKLSMTDRYVKYRARLAMMPKEAFAALDGAWISVYEKGLLSRSSYPEGLFTPKWTKVLAEVAREKGANPKGVLPHHAKTIDGTDGLKAFYKMGHIVETHLVDAYKAAGFDKVEGGRVYVGINIQVAGVVESPLAMKNEDTLDDSFWRAIQNALENDSNVDASPHADDDADDDASEDVDDADLTNDAVEVAA